MAERLSSPDLIRRLRTERVVAVLRAVSAADLERQLAICSNAGVAMIEITTTTPEWYAVARDFAASNTSGAHTLGIGTVTTVAAAELAESLDAQFLVSPYGVPDVRALRTKAVLIEGGFTPSELAALATRSSIAKLFPASSGGVSHLRAVRDVLPELEIMPTGGVSIETAPSWIAAGALAVGLGGGLFSHSTQAIADFVGAMRDAAPLASE